MRQQEGGLMGASWGITVTNSAFTATVTNNDDGTWSYQLNPPDGHSGTLPDSFVFTLAFDMGANDEYQFGAGTAGGDDSYTGLVTYPGDQEIQTQWTANKKSMMKHKHEAA
jgi:hypothetical protein